MIHETTVAVLAALTLGGCASTQCLVGASATPPAIATQVTAADGVCLESYEWRPANPEVKGVVVVIHGIRDHASRYATLAQALTDRGFVVVSYDMRGHGQSGGHRQRFDSIEELVADVDLSVQAARLKSPGRPVFVYGHSLGGLVASHYALVHQRELAGLVLSGAALKLVPTVTAGDIRLARFFGTLFPNLAAQEINDDWFVSTPEAKAEFMKDPLIDHENLPARSARTAVNAIEDISARNEELTLPMLIMHGTEDKQTNVEGSRELSQRAKSADKTLVLYEKQAHDLLHEPDRDKVIADVTKWIEAHVVTAP